MDFQTAIACANFVATIYEITKDVNPLHIYLKKYLDNKINNLSDETSKAVKQIPNENIQSPNISILLPAINESIYYLEKDEIKDMFKNLITSSFDKTKNEYAHPGFVGIIKQLSPKDACLLSFIKDSNDITGISLVDSDNKEYLVINKMFIDFESIKQCALSINNLSRLGLIVVKSRDSISYINSEDGYVEIDNAVPYENTDQLSKIAKNNNCSVYKVKAYLTVLGENFLKVCIE